MNDNKKTHKPWSIQDIVQVVLAFFTFLTLASYIYFSHRQSTQTQEAINRADFANSVSQMALNYSKESVELSKQVFDYTKHSDSLNDMRINQDAILSEKNIRRELRAYISVENYSIVYFDNTKFQFSFDIINTGKTPAYNVTIKNIFFFYEPDPKTVNNLANDPHKKFGRGIIGPGKPYSSAGEIQSFHDELGFKFFMEGKATLFLLNHINYWDVFGKKYYIQSCMTCIRQKDGSFFIVGYDKYNNAD